MQESLVTDITESEKRAALQRVIASSTFHRSDQLRSLLRYICERQISGTAGSLDEYTVAVEALGRPRDYSSHEDGAVRNRIHHLRHRLEHYYQVENPSDPVHVVLPKGSYRPVFQRHEQVLSGPLPPRQPALWNRPVPLWMLAAAACAALLLLAGWWKSSRTDQGIDPVLAEAWGPFLGGNAHPLICIATAAQLTLLQRPASPPTKTALATPELVEWYNSLPGLPPSKQVFLGPSLTSPFWGDVAGALAASQVLSRAGIAPEVLPESSIQVRGLNKRNVLMFGRPGFSRAIDLYLADKPFRVRIPDDQHGTAIWNVEPKSGEPAEYVNRDASREANREVAFGLITVMPSWGDPNLRTVVFSGTLSPGTQAASEFFASPKQLQALLRLLKKEGYSGFPASYQVVVRSNIFDTSALDVQYVSHRVISRGRQ